MSKLFFITGIPRTRGTWLANLLTHGSESICFHDALGRCPNPVELVRNMRLAYCGSLTLKRVGNSDSALLLHAEKIRSLAPKAQWIFIHRSVSDSVKSFENYFNAYPGAPKNADELKAVFDTASALYWDAFRSTPNAVDFFFEDLDDMKAIKEIWNLCLPDVAFPERRAQLLQEWQVNVMERKVNHAPEFLNK